MRSAMELADSLSRADVQLCTGAGDSNKIMSNAQIGDYMRGLTRNGCHSE
jgi:hypothetical protein